MEELIVGRPGLLVIDMQHDFVDPDAPFPLAGADGLIPRIARVVEAARAAGIPVVFTQEAHRPGRIDSGMEAVLGHPVHCVEGTRGVEIIPELAPREGDLIVRKRRFSAFLGSDLDLLLRGLGVRTVLVTGVDTHACVLHTAADAWQLDYRVRVIEDCVAATSLELHEAALTLIRQLASGQRVVSHDVIEALRAGRRP